jgi:acetolactate synthase I/II/III large subunit
MDKTEPVPRPRLPRRSFLQAAGVAGVAALTSGSSQAQLDSTSKSAPPRPNVAAETAPPTADPVTQTSGGADFMVDVLRSLNLEYVAINPASCFRGLHEAIVNYGGNSKPEILTCVHEEIACAMAQGYAKIEGKPIGVGLHGTVGLQHATMALYNAYCDKVPIYTMIGNIVSADKRGPWIEWLHSAQDPAALVRGFVKWDDQPASLQQFAESAVRAYKLSTTPPMGPVLLSLDAELQENPIAGPDKLRIPKLSQMTFPVGDSGAMSEVAQLLVKAEFPVLLVDRMARSQAGMDRLVELAELLQCAVIDQGGRANFPSLHPLNHTFRAKDVIHQADVVVGIELTDYWGALHSFNDRIVRRAIGVTRPDVKTVSVGTGDLFTKANYQDFQRFQGVDVSVLGDGEATLPILLEAVKSLLGADRRSAIQGRGAKLAGGHAGVVGFLRGRSAIGWDTSPITTGRLCAELWDQIRNDDWSLVGNGIGNIWPQALWDSRKSYNFTGTSGGIGMGYGAPGALGAALANRKHGRLSVAIQGDGDLMYTLGTLWTAAHHRIPILYVMHNNRSYNQERMNFLVMSGRRMRGLENVHIGTSLGDPDIDFATVAKGLGVYSEGPLTDPKDLAPALKRAIAVVKRGEPALLDVITEAR